MIAFGCRRGVQPRRIGLIKAIMSLMSFVVLWKLMDHPSSKVGHNKPIHLDQIIVSQGDMRVKKKMIQSPKFQPGWWKNHTRAACKLLELDTNPSAIEPKMLANVLVDDKHKLLYCQLAKVASTNLGKLFTFIAGFYNGTNPYDIVSDDIHHTYNKRVPHLNSLSLEEIMTKIRTYYKFVFVRDPLERVLSAYRNKLLHPANSYFANLSKKLVQIYRTNRTDHSPVTFIEFVSHLLDQRRQVPMNGHWKPMYQLCRPCELDYDFIGQLLSIAEDTRHILEVNHLSDVVTLPRRSRSHSFHQTDLYMKDYFSQVPKSMLLQLYNMYYPDYMIFNISLPEIIQEMFQ